MRVLIIDNYDSFTYNLYQYAGEIAETMPKVVYNDQITLNQVKEYNPDAIILSPGPGSPTRKKDFGISREIIQKIPIPVLGVCLGHQGIGAVFGAKITYAPKIFHGMASTIFHQGEGLFTGIPQGFKAIRYHSLVINEKTMPVSLTKTAWTDKNVLMGIQHKTRPLFGLQFHPESIGTDYGKKLLKNFFLIV